MKDIVHTGLAMAAALTVGLSVQSLVRGCENQKNRKAADSIAADIEKVTDQLGEAIIDSLRNPVVEASHHNDGSMVVVTKTGAIDPSTGVPKTGRVEVTQEGPAKIMFNVLCPWRDYVPLGPSDVHGEIVRPGGRLSEGDCPDVDGGVRIVDRKAGIERVLTYRGVSRFDEDGRIKKCVCALFDETSKMPDAPDLPAWHPDHGKGPVSSRRRVFVGSDPDDLDSLCTKVASAARKTVDRISTLARRIPAKQQAGNE
ncbi:MAG: hypothetical protein WC285_04410 [Candidatus Gracilibacteria bacterium]|jgi:hypothetical protein